MTIPCITLLALILSFLSPSSDPTSVIAESARLEADGKFAAASALLTEAAGRASGDERRILLFEKDRLRRIRLDYTLTRSDLLPGLRSSIRDLKDEEFDRWVTEGRFDARIIDDTLRFLGVSKSNLFWRYPDIAGRRTPPVDDSEFEKRVYETARTIMAAAAKERSPYVLPVRLKATATITVRPDAAPPGALVRAWLPVPRAFPHQRDIAVLSSSSQIVSLSPETSPIRSILLEQPASAGTPTEFAVRYAFTAYGVYVAVDPDSLRPYDPADPIVRTYTREGPHIVFTDTLRAVSASIVGSETNPARIARRLYDWIAENFLYSYALEYSTIRNLSDYCLRKGYGDCGQHAMLYIALCRMNGIPARWQSGWYLVPGGKTIHDWAEVYLPPYGWVPVDPDLGIFAHRYYTTLTPEQRSLVKDFYFGGLEQHRMAANSDHAQPLEPPKRSMRSEIIDFQRGEVEWGETNLYFDSWRYSLSFTEEPVGR